MRCRVTTLTFLACLCLLAQAGLGYELPDLTVNSVHEISTMSEGKGTAHSDAGVSNPVDPFYAFRNAKRDDAASKFKILGGQAMSRPCCVSWGPGRVDCFIRSATSSLQHLPITNKEYGEWADLGGVIMDEIECVSRGEGLIDILAVGEDHELHVTAFNGEWSEWIAKGFVMEVPGCTARNPTTINCVARCTSTLSWHIDSADGKWGSWGMLFGSPVSGVKCISKSLVDLACFACFSDNHLYENYFTKEDTYSGWEDLKGLVKGRPSVTSLSEDRVDIFVLGMANDVMQLTWNGEYQPWVSLGGTFESVPECVSTSAGQIHCFAVGENAFLYRNSFDGTQWSGWISSNGAFLDSPSCVVSNENEVSCYLRAFNKAIVEVIYTFE